MTARPMLHVVPHTHWDREWYEPFEVYRFQLVKVVDRLLAVLDRDAGFRHFHFDGQTAAIEDYLEVRPDAAPRVERLVREGRIAVGPWRILMDEFLCSGETILRNLRQGMGRARRLGGSPAIGYIPDSFGHISQMPQILRLAGIEDACVWRGVPSAVDRTAFVWEAPDGSAVRTIYLATSYANGTWLPATVDELMARARRIAADLDPFKPAGMLLVMNGSDHRGADDHLPGLFAEANARQQEYEFRIGSLPEYLRDFRSDELPRWRGELRSGARANLLMGVASARMPLKQAELGASREIERYAEPLTALSGSDPGLLLERAWRGLVENSAHDSICGCGIDAVADQVLARYADATRVAELVARDAAESLAERIDTRSIPATADGAVLFNPSPRPRGGVHEMLLTVSDPEDASFGAPDGRAFAAQIVGDPTDQILVDMVIRGAQLARIVPTVAAPVIGGMHVNHLKIDEGATTTIRLTLGPVRAGALDAEGAKRAVERLARKRPRGRFHVIATGPPLCRVLVEAPETGGLGWVTLAPRAGRAEPADPVRVADGSMSNAQLEARVAADGTIGVTHRASGRRYAGLLALRDGGDAGDEYNYSPPERDTIVDAAGSVQIRTVRSGPLEGAIEIRSRRRIPESLAAGARARSRRTVPLDAIVTVSLRSGEPFLRATIEVDNRARDHRLRAHFPLPFRAEVSHAETAFAVAERGREAEGGPHEHGLATYPCRRWVDASDGDQGLSILHAGTPEFELAEDGIALTLLRCVGWLSRSAMALRANPAGPPVETPGAQLLARHRFELAIYPHVGDWLAGDVYGAAEAFTLPFRAVVVRAHEGTLAAAGDGLRIDPACVQLSALSRFGGGVETRVFNASPDPVEAMITPGLLLPRASAEVIDLLGRSLARCRRDGETIRLPMRPWEIATVLLA